MINLKLWNAKRLHKSLFRHEQMTHWRKVQLGLAEFSKDMAKEKLNIALAELTNEEFQLFGEQTGYLEPKSKKARK